VNKTISQGMNTNHANKEASRIVLAGSQRQPLRHSNSRKCRIFAF
jgi:hypothetical protein